MLVVTGAAGFIGSATIWGFNSAGTYDVVAVDSLDHDDRWRNLLGKRLVDYVDREALMGWLTDHHGRVDAVIHLGACSDTTERDVSFLMRNNFEYSKTLWRWCSRNSVPLVYASSAATYGSGEHGFSDASETLYDLRPLNAYGMSKHLFDQWVLAQDDVPPMWAGLKFFNVYGPNEYHKGAMASVVFHAFNQIMKQGSVQLFRSYRAGIADGDQMRDFVYVKDVVNIIRFLLRKDKPAGLLNVGTGHSRTFRDLATAVFSALGRRPAIEYIAMPESLRERYQYRTQADISRLRRVGWPGTFTSLEDGVQDYVESYLFPTVRHL